MRVRRAGECRSFTEYSLGKEDLKRPARSSNSEIGLHSRYFQSLSYQNVSWGHFVLWDLPTISLNSFSTRLLVVGLPKFEVADVFLQVSAFSSFLSPSWFPSQSDLIAPHQLYSFFIPNGPDVVPRWPLCLSSPYNTHSRDFHVQENLLGFEVIRVPCIPSQVFRNTRAWDHSVLRFFHRAPRPPASSLEHCPWISSLDRCPPPFPPFYSQTSVFLCAEKASVLFFLSAKYPSSFPYSFIFGREEVIQKETIHSLFSLSFWI